jgi:hypothetical protein
LYFSKLFIEGNAGSEPGALHWTAGLKMAHVARSLDASPNKLIADVHIDDMDDQEEQSPETK